MVLCSRRVFWSRIVALAVRRVFIVAAMLAMSVCMRCSVRVKLDVAGWLVLLSKGACRVCLVVGFPRGVGLSRSSSMYDMSESAIEEAMSLSDSVAS